MFVKASYNVTKVPGLDLQGKGSVEAFGIILHVVLKAWAPK